MSFLQLAEPFLAVNIPVFPLQSRGKLPYSGTNGCKDATIDIEQVRAWDSTYGDCNVGIAALAGGEFCFLEFDAYGIKSAAAEMGQPVPETRMQRSGSGGGHLIFKHTERSRELGNRSANLAEACTCDRQEQRPCQRADCKLFTLHHHHEWFSFRADNKYLVGAGSVHPNGNLYKTVKDIEPIPVPDWICDFVERHTEVSKSKSEAGASSVSDDFSFDDFCDFYGMSGHQDGDWFITDECPISGRRHRGSFRTGFFYDGNSLGFHCFAQGCDGSNMTVGQVIGYMNKEKGEPYRGVIWEHDDENLFDVQDVNDVEDALPEVPEVVEPLEAAVVAPTNPCVVDGRLLPISERVVTAEPGAIVAESDEDDDDGTTEAESAKPLVDPALRLIGTDGSGLLVKKASDYEMTELEWLWPQRIPKGKISLYTGKPDCCKSMALLDLIARVSSGRDFPDGTKNELGPRQVLLAASEDDPNDTIIPRLKAVGANLENVSIIVGTVVNIRRRKNDKPVRRRENLNMKRDAKRLLEVIKEMPDLTLLALDPLTSFFGDADQNKDKEIRPIMDEINRVCNKSGITIVGIIHSNKRSDVDAVHKVSGAGSLAAAVRAVWGFSRDTEDKMMYHMAFVKGNLGKVKSGINYSVVETHIDIKGKSVGVPQIIWGETIEEDADDLLKAERNNKDTKDTKSLIAVALIRSMIPAKAKDIFRKADAEGISEATVRKARYNIDGLVAKPRAGEWWWYMPDNPYPATKQEKEATVDMIA